MYVEIAKIYHHGPPNFYEIKYFSVRNIPPGSLRRKFNPNRKKIKNLITSVKIETRHSKIDQENDANVKEDWGKWADIYFTPTQYLISK